jgi:hypothetical protein
MNGKRFELRTDSSGDLLLSTDRIGHIGIRNIADLKAYNMSRVGNRLMHVIEFSNGGTLEVTLLVVAPGTAKVEIFKGHKIALQYVDDDLIVGEMH